MNIFFLIDLFFLIQFYMIRPIVIYIKPRYLLIIFISKLPHDKLGAAVTNFFPQFFFISVKPSLKKVSKNENKFAKLQKKAQEFNFRQNLKVVKKPEFSIKDEEDQGVSTIYR